MRLGAVLRKLRSENHVTFPARTLFTAQEEQQVLATIRSRWSRNSLVAKMLLCQRYYDGPKAREISKLVDERLGAGLRASVRPDLALKEVAVRAYVGSQKNAGMVHTDRGYLVFVYAFGNVGTIVCHTNKRGTPYTTNVRRDHCIILSGRLRYQIDRIEPLVHRSPASRGKRFVLIAAFAPSIIRKAKRK